MGRSSTQFPCPRNVLSRCAGQLAGHEVQGRVALSASDGYVSAGIIVSAVFIALGPITDQIIGLLVVALIFDATWESWVTIRRG